MYLVDLKKKNDEDKFIQLYKLYKFKMLRIAKRILKDDFLSEDAVHNTFIKIIKNMEIIGDVKSIKTKNLIITMTKNTSIDLYRNRNNQMTDMNFSDMEIADTKDVEDDVVSRTAYDDIVNEILKLPEKQRQLLYLKYVHEFDIKTIAEIMNMSYDGAQKGIQRSRELLISNLVEREKKDNER